MNSGLIIGNRIVRLPACASTNDSLKELAQESKQAMEGLVVVTDNQVSGRGQQGTSWDSEPGKNLCFSIYLKPNLDLDKQFLLTQVISLGLADFLAKGCSKPVSVKWPNDVYVGGKKLAGVLIENSVKEGKIAASVVGIGLNVNQLSFDASLPNPGSMSLLNEGETYDLKDVLKQVLACIEVRYLAFKTAKDSTQLKSDYHQKLYQLDQTCDYVVKGKQIKGTIKGVNPLGELLMEHDGSVHAYRLKEVSFQ